MRILGFYPDSISYPNGNFSKNILSIASNTGYKYGFTTVRKQNVLPINDNNLLSVSRFIFPKMDINNIDKFLLTYEKNFSIYNSLINFYSKFVK